MADSFLFNLDPPAAGEDAIASFNVYNSADQGVNWNLTDNIPVSALVDDPSGQKQLSAPNADPSMTALILTVSAAGVERPTGTIIPPQPAAPNLCTLSLSTVDLLGVAVENAALKVRASSPAVVNGKLVDGEKTFYTQADGTLAIDVVQGVALKVHFGSGRGWATVDTTGKTFVDLAPLFA